MKLIALFLLFFTTICTSQTQFKSISNDIVDFYIMKNELDKDSKQEILDNFDGLITIKELVNKNYFKCCNDGIYEISPNVTHTSVNLLIVKNSHYSILSVDDNFTDVFNRVSLILQKNKLINKQMTIKYLQRLVQIAEDNRNIKRNNTLE